MDFSGYTVYVIVNATTPIVYYRSGKRKGEVKSGGLQSKVLETPTFFLSAAAQGIENEEQATEIASDIAFSKRFHESLVQLGYTEIECWVHCVKV